ncbi:IS200/IS605 family transposase [Microscilla marina]|uniref:Transposase n=1 Tax=Microscilla marina ATCC 23134 TaxID=313606 RepID=A1ZGJ3_MICM2|nr:IS200/IS605 family transposase [Microscilla marina]EAY30610.1 transposase [Microscilla marina ATCC 23134]
MEKRWKSSKNSVYSLGYHIIWCPKYRRKVLTEEIQKRLKELLLLKAKSLGIEIQTMETMTDHVHLFIKAKPVDAPHFIVGQLKGYTSRYLRKEFPKLRSRLPTLWTRSYYIESVGRISEKNIKKYIENQKNV